MTETKKTPAKITKQTQKKKSTISDIVQFFYGFDSKHKVTYRLMLLFAGIAPLISTMQWFIYGDIIGILTDNSDNVWELVKTQFMYYIIFIIFVHISYRFLEFLTISNQSRTIHDISSFCFQKIHAQEYNFFTNNFAGSLNKSIDKVGKAYETYTDTIVWNFIPILVRIILLLTMLYNIGAMYMVGFSLILLILITVQRFLYNWKYSADQEYEDNILVHNGYITDTFTNTLTIKAGGYLQLMLASMQKSFDHVESLRKKSGNRRNVVNGVVGILMGTIEIFFLLFMVYQRKLGLIDIALVITIRGVLQRVLGDMRSISRTIKNFFSALAESTNALDIIHRKTKVTDIHDAIQTPENIIGHIHISGLRFGYKNHVLFDGLNIDISGGEKIALVGHSGSGKTSLSSLILRLYDPQGGKITIDGIDIRSYTQESYRKLFSFVSQEPLLFHTSIRENICYGAHENISQEDIMSACIKASCRDFIKKLDQGLDTIVGERGVKLSGGEKQRIVLARAFLQQRPILLLDEATSALDSESEQKIQKALASLMQNKTCIFIAHRLSTIMHMDKIIVLDEGKIIEIGTHADLLTQQGKYSHMRHIQSGKTI